MTMTPETFKIMALAYEYEMAAIKCNDCTAINPYWGAVAKLGLLDVLFAQVAEALEQ